MMIAKRAYIKWKSGKWRWIETLSLIIQLVRIARSEISHIVRDSVVVLDIRLANGAKNSGGSCLWATLECFFAVVCAVIGWVVVVRFGLLRSL